MKLSAEILRLFLDKDPLVLGTGEVASIKLNCGEQRYITEAIEELEQSVKNGQLDALVSLPEIRKAIANYMRSEGCGCCRDTAAHEKHEETIAKLLNVPMYKDGSGYDFKEFRAT